MKRIKRIFFDWYGLRGIWAIVLIITCVLLLAVGIRYTAHSIDKANCHGKERATGRNTTFADYSWWSWDCLTVANDKKKIPFDNNINITGIPNKEDS